MLGGVAVGLAAHLGRPVRQVRVAFALGMVLGGGGRGALPVAVGVGRSADVVARHPVPGWVGLLGGDRRAGRPVPLGGARVGDLVVGGLLLLAGVSLLGARFGFAVPVQVVLPVLVVLGGALLAYAQLDEVERSRWASITGSGTRGAVLRGAAGPRARAGGRRVRRRPG